MWHPYTAFMVPVYGVCAYPCLGALWVGVGRVLGSKLRYVGFTTEVHRVTQSFEGCAIGKS